MNYKILFSFTVLFISLIGCNKEIADTNECECCSECVELPEPDGVVDVFYESIEQFKFPCYNPNDNNEFVYYYSNSNDNLYQIRKYNIESKESSIVVDNMIIISKPSWGKNNWIIFADEFAHLMKVKSNGDSLSFFSAINHNMYPNWDSNDNVIFVYTKNGGVPHNVVSKNIYSSIFDTIYIGDSRLLTISNNDNIATVNDYCNIEISSLSDINNWTKITNVEYHGEIGIYAICWHPFNNSIYYSRTLDGLYYINIADRYEIKIKDACNSRIYECISISPDANKILVERKDCYYVSDVAGLIRDSRIYIMDIDGCNEHQIELN